MSYCPKCGAQLPDNARFCGICGAPIASAPAAGQFQQQQTGGYAPQYRQQTGSYNTQQFSQQQTGGYAPQYPQQQYQQPRQQNYGWQQQQYPQQQYQQQYQQPRQYGAGDYGWQRPTPPEKPVRHLGLLRLLSILFALGLIAAAVGIGCQLYFDRSYDKIHDSALAEIRETYKDSEQNTEVVNSIDDKVVARNKADIRSLIAAMVREDPKGLKTALKNTLIDVIRDTDELSEIYSASSDNIKTFVSDLADSVEDQLILEYAKEFNKECSQEFGFRWLMLQVGARSLLVVMIGGGLALLCFLLWLILHGPSAGAARSWFVPMLVIALLLAAAIIAVSLFVIDPVTFPEIRTALSKEGAMSWSEAKQAEINELTDKTGTNIGNVIQKHQSLLLQAASSVLQKYPELSTYLNLNSLPISLN